MKFHNLLIILLIILVIFGTGARFLSINKDFSADELDFVKAAEALRDTGKLIFYHSEQQPWEIGLWHPPLYIFLIRSSFFLFEGELAARIVNVVFSLLGALLIFFLCFRFVEGNKGVITGLAASSLFLINYYVFSSSLLIDIDMLSAFFVFAYVFSVLSYVKSKSPSFMILSVLSLFFAIFNRYPMAFLSYMGLGLLLISKRKITFLGYFFIGLFAFVLFLGTWGFYSHFIEPGSFFIPFEHNSRLAKEQFSSVVVYLGSLVINIIQFIRLFTLPFFLLLFPSLHYFLKERKTILTNALMSYSLPIFIFFILLPRPAFGYPRYFITAMPAFFILISLFLYDKLSNFSFDMKKGFSFFILSFVISLLLLILLRPQMTFFSQRGLVQATNLPDFILNLLCCLPLMAAFFVRKKYRTHTFLIITLGLLASYSLYFDTGFLLHDYKTKEAGNYIKEHTLPTDIIIAPKGVAYYAERKVYVNGMDRPRIDFSISFLWEYVKKSLYDRMMESRFFWPDNLFSGIYRVDEIDENSLRGATYVVLNHGIKNRQEERKIGDFYIYRMNK